MATTKVLGQALGRSKSAEPTEYKTQPLGLVSVQSHASTNTSPAVRLDSGLTRSSLSENGASV